MASTFSNLKFEIIGNGEQSGTWGTTTNTNIGTAIEQAIVGMATLSSGDFTANVATLTLANTNAAQNARALCLNIAAGAVSAAGTINVPAIQKPYIIINGSSFTVTVKVSGQTGVAVPAGKRTVVYNNGTDVGSQIDWLAALDITTINATTVDATNVEATNLKAKDGTASITLANATGIASFSANPIFSGGTANGVAYLNGSKVLTTGSALTFDGTNFGVGGAADAWSATYKAVQINGTVPVFGSQSQYMHILSNAYNDGSWKYKVSSAAARYSQDIGVHYWDTAVAGTAGAALTWSEQMRLTSTGLGIGTSSPGAKLDVNGSGNVARFGDGTNTFNVRFKGPNNWDQQLDTVNDRFSLRRNSVDFVVVDPSGNLGLGVTPSAWNGAYKALDISNWASLAGEFTTQGSATLAVNAFANSTGYNNWTYRNTGAATRYKQNDGIHSWFTAPSGTAGNAISFTQAMTLDANGNLLVGTTSSINTGRFCIKNSGTQNIAAFQNGSDGGYGINFLNVAGTQVGAITWNASATTYATSSDYRLKNITGPITNSGAYIDSLNPVEGTWKADGSTFVGLIAHEVQEASRTQVATGTKDGEQMQAMDYSSAEIIANLIAEVKSLRQRVAALES